MKSGTKSDERGLRCRYCGHTKFRVIYTRAAFGARIVRRRQCRRCGKRVTTWEKMSGLATDVTQPRDRRGA